MSAVDKRIILAMDLGLAVLQTYGTNGYVGTYAGNISTDTAAGSNIETGISVPVFTSGYLYPLDLRNCWNRPGQCFQELFLLPVGRLQHDQNAFVAIVYIPPQTHFGSQPIDIGTETHSLNQTADMYVIFVHR